MAQSITLAFYKNDHFGYVEAKKHNAVHMIDLTYGEAHKGMSQTAVYDALEIITEVKKCFGIDEPLNFVLLDGETIIDVG